MIRGLDYKETFGDNLQECVGAPADAQGEAEDEDEPDVAGAHNNYINDFFEALPRKKHIHAVDLNVIRDFCDNVEETVLRTDTDGRTCLVCNADGTKATYLKPRILQLDMTDFLKKFQDSNAFRAWQQANERTVTRKSLSGEKFSEVVSPTISRSTFVRGLPAYIISQEKQRDTADRLSRELEMALEAMDSVQTSLEIWKDLPTKKEAFLEYIYCNFVNVPELGIHGEVSVDDHRQVQQSNIAYFAEKAKKIRNVNWWRHQQI